MFQVDLRLDQAPGVWLTAKGSAPLGLFDRSQPEQPIHLSIQSSPIALGLVEGLTTVVKDVAGEARLNFDAIGTTRDPHFAGTVELQNVSFLVPLTGARYKNGRATFDLAQDRVTVAAFHLEDRNGRALD